VRDSGPGIAVEDQARLFQPFSQVDESLTRRHGGAGLGLAISRQLVTLMGGRLSCTSVLGSGATFALEIPLAALADHGWEPLMAPGPVALALAHAPTRCAVATWCAAWGLSIASDGKPAAAVVDGDHHPTLPRVALRYPGAAVPAEAIAIPRPFAPAQLHAALAALFAGTRPGSTAPETGKRCRGRVLVVEDQPINRALVRAQLAELGVICDCIDRGEEAVALLAERRHDLVLLDLQMPGMDGLAVARGHRRGEPPGRRVPIVALTACAMPGDRERCLAAGMDDYLAKPCQLAELRQTLVRWLPVEAPAELGLAER
jgi:CheY-like chemotaxis protein